MAVPLEFLQNLEGQFSSVRDGGAVIAVGQTVVCHVMQATPLLTVTDILAAPLDVAWIAKDVRFNTAGPEAALDATPFQSSSLLPLITGGMPARVPVVGNFVGTQELQGVPGLLGQLAGAIPIPVQVPIGVSIHWEVLDADGVTVLAESAATFTSDGGVDASEVRLVFPVQVEELTSAALPTTAIRFVRATITLNAGTTSHSFQLPNLPLVLPAIQIPTVLVFFLHTNFAPKDGDNDGACLVMVPSNSPLASIDQLQPVLDVIRQAATNLTAIAEFASFVLGLQVLSNALAAQPHIEFRVADAIGNLNDVTLISRPWYQNDTEAEDELSSLIFIGKPGKKVDCFNDRHLDEGEGWFELTIGRRVDMIEGAVEVQTPNMFALIRTLHAKQPVSEPTGSEIDVKKEPDGWNTMLAHSISSFGDELSSVRFLP